MDRLPVPNANTDSSTDTHTHTLTHVHTYTLSHDVTSTVIIYTDVHTHILSEIRRCAISMTHTHTHTHARLHTDDVTAMQLPPITNIQTNGRHGRYRRHAGLFHMNSCLRDASCFGIL